MESIDPGGIDVFSADLAAFRAALTAENRTLKRALTDPRILSGIGNAYSDEILHAAQLSPIALTHKLKPEEWDRLYHATRATLQIWIDRFVSEARQEIPRESDRLPAGNGRPWPLQPALPSLRQQNPAHPLRRQRNQLLPDVPNGRKAAGRPRALATARFRLAPKSRRTGSAEAPLILFNDGLRCGLHSGVNVDCPEFSRSAPIPKFDGGMRCHPGTSLFFSLVWRQ